MQATVTQFARALTRGLLPEGVKALHQHVVDAAMAAESDYNSASWGTLSGANALRDKDLLTRLADAIDAL